MTTSSFISKMQRQDTLAFFIAAGLASLSPGSLAQSDYKSIGYISQEALSTVMLARQSATEVDLRRIALKLLDYYDPNTQSSANNATLKLAPAGTEPKDDEYFKNKILASKHFFYLPKVKDLNLSKAKDSNGLPIAYCAFELPFQPESKGRLTGTTKSDIAEKDAIGFVIISAGSNGLYEFTCDNFRDVTVDRPVTRISGNDDVYVTYTFSDITYSGANSRFLEKSVGTYNELELIEPADLYEDQIRWVRTTNQFFRYSSTDKWQPLNAGFKQTVDASDKTKTNLNWLSGSMGIGTLSQSTVVGPTTAKALLTLGTKQQDQSGIASTNPSYLAGVGFNKSTDALFAYIGLIDDNTFSLRQDAVNRMALDSSGNLTLNGTTLKLNGPTTVNGIFDARQGITSTTATFSELLSANGGLFAKSGEFSGDLSASNGAFRGVLSGASITTGGSLLAGSISTAGTLSSGPLSATTGEFSGNLSAINGTFSGVLSGASITTGGSLSAGSISTAGTLSSGPLSAKTGKFSELLTADGGLKATTGDFSEHLSATTGTFSGLLTAGGGLKATTGDFSEHLSATTGTFSGLLLIRPDKV
jgi:hypothetical protein